MMSPLQCRLGRLAVGWSAGDLAKAAKVGVNTVTRYERGSDARTSSVSAMRDQLEAAGVTFVASGEASLSGGEGVRYVPPDLAE